MEQVLTALIGALCNPERGRPLPIGGCGGVLRLAVAAGLIAMSFGALNRASSWQPPVSVAYDAKNQGR